MGELSPVVRGEIPGTHEPGFEPPPILQHRVSSALRHLVHGLAPKGVKLPLSCYSMGDCSVLVACEPEGINGEMRWHMSVSCPDRHPTWDELKTLRYRLLPLARAFAIILPPPQFYVNVPGQDHVFHLHEIDDPARPWETM